MAALEDAQGAWKLVDGRESIREWAGLACWRERSVLWGRCKSIFTLSCLLQDLSSTLHNNVDGHLFEHADLMKHVLNSGKQLLFTNLFRPPPTQLQG